MRIALDASPQYDVIRTHRNAAKATWRSKLYPETHVTITSTSKVVKAPVLDLGRVVPNCICALILMAGPLTTFGGITSAPAMIVGAGHSNSLLFSGEVSTIAEPNWTPIEDHVGESRAAEANVGSSEEFLKAIPPATTSQARVALAGVSPSTTVVQVTWLAPSPISYGTPLTSVQLNATASLPGTFLYAQPAGTVLTGGGHTLTATFVPSATAGSGPVVVTTQLFVRRVVPRITWASPSTMPEGVQLGTAQLNATANVAGRFTYTPAPGALLASGTQRLTVAFSPTDVIDYSSETRYRSISVIGSQPAQGAPVVALSNSMSMEAIQSAFNQAPTGATILFQTGTYGITSPILIPCNNLHVTGPPTPTPSVILAASFTGRSIFAFGPGCPTLGSIKHLRFQNTGAVYFGAGDNSNLVFESNLIANLPSGMKLASEAGLFFDGTLGTTLSNVLIRFNTFGDDDSCATVFQTGLDEGGYCAGIITSQGKLVNITIEYNNFTHVEEGIHFEQLAQYVVGTENSTCISCVIEYNYILNHHRIGIEVQVSTPVNALLIEHNAIVDPINSSWLTFGVSMACCQWGGTLGQSGVSPGFIFDDNVIVATLPAGNNCPPIGVEFWGTGSQGIDSLVEGAFCNGYDWGYGGSEWEISYNYICGPGVSSDNGGYITNEENESNPPIMSGNISAAVCSSQPSIAPTILIADGPSAESHLVTLQDEGANTSIWFTTDGSTPVPGVGTAQYYTAPFLTTSGAVKAVGMWGSANQPTIYPPGYGYVPSNVVTASTLPAAAAQRVATVLTARAREELRSVSTTRASVTEPQGRVLQFDHSDP